MSRPAAAPRLPAGACDCHTHVFGPTSAYPMAADRHYTPGEASLSALEALHQELGIARVVVVQPTPYGADNRCTLDAVWQANAHGEDRARAVVVLDEGHDLAALQAMHAAGARGVRVNLETGGLHDPALGARLLREAAARVAPLGWHVQVFTNLRMVVALADTLHALPVPVVLDHFGGLRGEGGLAQEGLSTLEDLLDTGWLYIKLSAAQRASTAPDCADLGPLVRRLVARRPDRLLWGSDWPHPAAWLGVRRDPAVIEPFHPIDDRRALARLAEWVPDAEHFAAILAGNPADLYGWKAAAR